MPITAEQSDGLAPSILIGLKPLVGAGLGDFTGGMIKRFLWLVWFSLMAPGAFAQSFPAKPLRLIVPTRPVVRPA